MCLCVSLYLSFYFHAFQAVFCTLFTSTFALSPPPMYVSAFHVMQNILSFFLSHANIPTSVDVPEDASTCQNCVRFLLNCTICTQLKKNMLLWIVRCAARLRWRQMSGSTNSPSLSSTHPRTEYLMIENVEFSLNLKLIKEFSILFLPVIVVGLVFFTVVGVFSHYTHSD